MGTVLLEEWRRAYTTYRIPTVYMSSVENGTTVPFDRKIQVVHSPWLVRYSRVPLKSCKWQYGLRHLEHSEGQYHQAQMS